MLHFSRWLMQPVQFEIHRSVHHESVNHRGHTRSFYWITKRYTTLETSHTDNFVYFIAAVVNDKNSDICVEPWVSKPRLMNRFSPIRDLKFSQRGGWRLFSYFGCQRLVGWYLPTFQISLILEDWRFELCPGVVANVWEQSSRTLTKTVSWRWEALLFSGATLTFYQSTRCHFAEYSSVRVLLPAFLGLTVINYTIVLS